MLPCSLLLAALAASPSLADASMSWDGEILRVTASTDAPMAADQVRAELSGRTLRLHLTGARLAEAERRFDSRLKAWRSPFGVTLEAPISRKIECTGAPTVTSTRQGLVVTAPCALKGASAALIQSKALQAALALPVEPAATEWVALPPPALPTPVAAVATAPAKPTPIPSLESTHGKSLSSLTNPAPAAATVTPLATGDSEGWMPGWLMPLLGLAGLGAAWFFAKKKAKAPRLVQVLETANLGPKRALIVARVGGRTLLLGTSETGLSLLTTLPEDAKLEAAADSIAAGFGVPEFESEPPADKESGSSQASFLTRLIAGAQKKTKGGLGSFEDLLSESAEDQDLRRKLEAGLAGRVA